MAKPIKESRTLAVREAEGTKSGRLLIGLITPGWGSSGYYSQKVLENAADARVFPAGTQMFLDHETESEKFDRPERSVRDLAAVLTEDATWDGRQLVGEAQVFGAYNDMLTDEDFVKAIGVSIRALADSTVGEAEGRKGRIITNLAESLSVDFVTRAGRGGQVLQVLESARGDEITHRAEAHGVSEATSNDTLTALQNALKDELGGEKSWVWVRDFDESTVWFVHETPDESHTYEQGYTLDDDMVAALDGDRAEVRAATEYVPVSSTTATERAAAIAYATDQLVKCGVSETDAQRAATSVIEAFRLVSPVPAPAGQTHPTQTSKEDTMGNIQVDEAQHASLTEAAGRVPTLESERDTAITERDAAREALAARDRSDAAVTIIEAQATEAGVTFTALERRGLMVGLPQTDDGTLDAVAFTESAKTAAAEKAAQSGAGSITGFGRSTDTSSTDVVAEARAAAGSAFGRTPTKIGA